VVKTLQIQILHALIMHAELLPIAPGIIARIVDSAPKLRESIRRVPNALQIPNIARPPISAPTRAKSFIKKDHGLTCGAFLMWGAIAAIAGASVALALARQALDAFGGGAGSKEPAEKQVSLPPPDKNMKKSAGRGLGYGCGVYHRVAD
jgi:hypothetical protein